MTIEPIKEKIISVGVKDTKSPYFDQLMPLPEGTTYNSFIVKGSEKTALIESVEPGFEDEFLNNLKEAGVEKIDYIISNHAEQDHSGCFPKLLNIYPESLIVTNEKCKEFIQHEMDIDDSKFKIVSEGETLSIGNKTFKFIMTPWVHWPETMCTYLEEDKILFSGDLFGAHIAFEELICKDNEYVKPMQRYYAEIMMPFSKMIEKHLGRIKELELEIIAPTHGQIYTNPKEILELYTDWVSSQTKKKVSIIYITMHHSTEEMAKHLKQKLDEKGIQNNIHNLATDDLGDVTIDIMDAHTLVVCSPTYLGGLHPTIANALFLLNGFKPKVKEIGFLNSHGWQANGGFNQLKEFIKIPGVEFLEPVAIEGKPRDKEFEKIDTLAEEIKNKLDSF